MTFIACAVLIAFIIVMVRIATSPLFRTLSIVIDDWADGVHGDAQEPG